MIELLFLLLPLAFYSGWKSARRDNQKERQASTKLSDSYVKGVNYLLSEKPDKALEVFINHPDVDEYTAETYLLLGNMFRNRGEVDRALRLHQNLMGRSSLNKQQKASVMYALGEDFSAAGMLDRAEGVFQELLSANPNDSDACASLRKIYEQTLEWDKAIQVTQCLKKSNLPIAYQKLIAHYYCEMADLQLAEGNLHKVEELISKAEKSCKDSARVIILKADLHERKKQYKAALQLYLKSLKIDSRLVSYLFERTTKVAALSGMDGELLSTLQELYQQDASVLAYYLQLLLTKGNNAMVNSFLNSDFESNKLDTQSIIQLISLLEQSQTILREPEKLALVKSSLSNSLKGKAAFQCKSCGYKMQDYLWRCPACYNWDVVAHVE